MSDLVKKHRCTAGMCPKEPNEFGGLDMPLWYSSAKNEHLAVLSHAGMFDTSHMAVITLPVRMPSSCCNYALQMIWRLVWVRAKVLFSRANACMALS